MYGGVDIPDLITFPCLADMQGIDEHTHSLADSIQGAASTCVDNFPDPQQLPKLLWAVPRSLLMG